MRCCPSMISLTVWELTAIRGSSRPLSDYIKPALFVPPQQPLVELLPILRNREDQSAVVVDEYGSAIGLITVDRIIETIVGQVGVGSVYEYRDETVRPTYESLGDDAYLLDARLPVAEVNELLETRLRLSEARTIGGYVVACLRHVPAVGERLVDSGYAFTVAEVTDRAIVKLHAEPED